MKAIKNKCYFSEKSYKFYNKKNFITNFQNEKTKLIRIYFDHNSDDADNDKFENKSTEKNVVNTFYSLFLL